MTASAIRMPSVACPFFIPTGKLDDGGWLHPSRLPLGGGWRGQCSAPGHEGVEPTVEELREGCNLGYAATCPRLPRQRNCDAVRFSVVRDAGGRLELWAVCESAHRPAAHGKLTYDRALGRWTSAHPDARIQKMADCYLQSYLLRNFQPSSSSVTHD